MSTTTAPAFFCALLATTLSLSIMLSNQLVAEGLPITRRVRGAEGYDDILAGNDFLSVLLESTLHRVKKETTTVSEESFLDVLGETSTEPLMRETREASDYDAVPQTTEAQLLLDDSISSSTSDFSDGVIIAVHVSSSVGSQINKDTARVDKDSALDQNILSSEEQSSIVANSGKSELNVEEPTPITKTNEESNVNFNRLQASVQSLPSSQHIAFNPSGFSKEQNKDNLPPFHHSLIYHDNPSQPGRGRSVSFSTIIQDVPGAKHKMTDTLERKERHYETGGPIYGNSYEKQDGTKDDFVTSTTSTTTTKSWAPQSPRIYGKPEQNYEVDEAVSVVTNGRSHGVQQAPNIAIQKPKSDQEKDQKVGYVVEGRNYRKYRVEERTPEGFIVGEYGVVSHDDGSLRGVRYTADGTINPRLIYDALMKFLAL